MDFNEILDICVTICSKNKNVNLVNLFAFAVEKYAKT
jgi:hypothetical protein